MLATVKLYGAIAVLLAVFGLVLFAGYEYDARKDDMAALLAVQGQVSTLQGNLKAVQAGQAADTAAIATLAASQAAVTIHATAVRQRVATMKGNDDAVRAWLDTVGPPSLCMLDDTCTGAGAVPATIGGAASSVR